MGLECTLLPREKSNVVLVSGYRAYGDPDSVKKVSQEACWDLYSYIYNVGPRGKNLESMKVIVNDSSVIRGVDKENVKQLHERLHEMSLDEVGISLVIIAHSFGVNIALQALKEDTLKEFLISKNVSESEATTRIKKIREHLAVFGFGGAEDFPVDIAQVSCNVRLKQDYTARIVKPFLASNHGRACEYAEFAETVAEPNTEQNSSSLFGNVLSSTSASTKSTSASTSTKHYHYLVKYLQCGQLMEYISKRIGLEDK